MTDYIPTPLLVLDIDGTVRQGKDELGRFVNGAEDVYVFPEAVTMMNRWKKEKGGRILGTSNQGGIALGFLGLNDAINAFHETQAQTGDLFDRISFCQHHPDADDPEYARCWCRKPAPGLVIEGAIGLAERFREMYPPHLGLFVGDRPEDEECARILNMDFQWAADWRGKAT